MFGQLVATIKGELSGSRAFHHVEEVVRHHRIQASPGYRDAARYCLSALEKAGVDGEILTYPSNRSTAYWSQLMWQEWACDKAELKLIEPEQMTLASFDECKISLIQRSISTPPGGVTAEVVLLDRGDEASVYADVDLNGKIVFTGGDMNAVRKWAVEERGALGVITDRLAEFPPVRHRYDIPDARQYTSFWWVDGDQPCFGFVLSPKLGDHLRRLCREMAASHERNPELPAAPKVHAEVQARLYDGAIENVSGFIPGETDEEILITAHLCHPQHSANDNASGVAVALESIRTLSDLISCGKLPKPRRGIRILLVPEMTGTYAYLASNPERIPKTLAAINLDMVGERQELCGGPLVAEHPPQATESFVGDLIDAIMAVCGKEVTNLGGTSSYALYKYTSSPFSGGSDHYILSDPSVNIPCPMLIQWPDKFYHTSEDTIDKVDPQMLYRVGAMTATYAYFLATMDRQSATWMLGETAARFTNRLTAYLQERLAAIAAKPGEAGHVLAVARKQLDFRWERCCRQIESMDRFVSESDQAAWKQTKLAMLVDLEQTMNQHWQRLATLVRAMGVTAEPVEAQPRPYVAGEELIPVRTYPGPVSMRGHVERLSSEEQKQYRELSRRFGFAAMRTTTCALYWADGKRTITEICDLVEQELGVRNLPFMVEYLESLATMGLLTLHEAKADAAR
ncbi:MAG: DUF4910 domain-containing protein [Bacillota bacterium]